MVRSWHPHFWEKTKGRGRYLVFAKTTQERLGSAQDRSALVLLTHPTLSGHPTAFSWLYLQWARVNSHKRMISRVAEPWDNVCVAGGSWSLQLVWPCSELSGAELWHTLQTHSPASPVPQIYATSTALSGCLPLVSAPREVLLLCSLPNTHSSHKPYWHPSFTQGP